MRLVRDTADRKRLCLLAIAMMSERLSALAEVVEPCRRRAGFRSGPVKAVGVQPRVLAAVGRAATAEKRVEARAAAAEERLERAFTGTGNHLVTNASVALRHLAPVVLGRQSPSVAERLTSALCRFPRVQATPSTTVPFHIAIAIGVRSLEVQILGHPTFAVRHRFGLERGATKRQRAIRGEEQDGKQQCRAWNAVVHRVTHSRLSGSK